MQPSSPSSREDILQALAGVEAEVAAFFASLSADEFVLRVGDAWTPAEHLAHLNVSVSAVARGVGMPRALLLLRFGPSFAASRPYEAIRETYRATLAGGGRASGVYVPPRDEASGEQVEEHRNALLARWARANFRLRGTASGWSERALDRIRLPHPLLGKLTTREMLFFTLYHNQHHVDAAKRRLPRFGATAVS